MCRENLWGPWMATPCQRRNPCFEKFPKFLAFFEFAHANFNMCPPLLFTHVVTHTRNRQHTTCTTHVVLHNSAHTAPVTLQNMKANFIPRGVRSFHQGPCTLAVRCVAVRCGLLLLQLLAGCALPLRFVVGCCFFYCLWCLWCLCYCVVVLLCLPFPQVGVHCNRLGGNSVLDCVVSGCVAGGEKANAQ